MNRHKTSEQLTAFPQELLSLSESQIADGNPIEEIASSCPAPRTGRVPLRRGTIVPARENNVSLQLGGARSVPRIQHR